MYWLSGAESEKFVKSIEDAYEKVRRMGPNPIKTLNIEVPEKEILVSPVE